MADELTVEVNVASLLELQTKTPICNRCHELLHHKAGVGIEHPTLESIQHIISESPHKYNHVYHVLDAADFPLSVIPNLQRYLSLTPQRCHNRRARVTKFYQGRRADMSFIITRSDLLAPRKEQVDEMMPYLREVLRDALGFSTSRTRLGNLHCVSSKRGWWTKKLKEDIWARGGGGWLVGKVNVGKSSLFESIFPKGRSVALPSLIERRGNSNARSGFQQISRFEKQIQEDLLLPPARAETPYPIMPVVSHLPGTTAAPIRLSFGGGKGELVDLPGLPRDSIENHARDDHKLDLLMQHRVSPKQLVIKPGQSLLLGDVVRITPATPEIIVLAYPFLPIECYVTSTTKAIEIQTRKELAGISDETMPEIEGKMALAGTFPLKWDVTKKRAGPLTSSRGADLSTNILPFSIFSTDILIESCGWIELVVQARKKSMSIDEEGGEMDGMNMEVLPQVNVYSPEGKSIGARRPMNAWLVGGPKLVPLRKRIGRPKRSMKGSKKRKTTYKSDLVMVSAMKN